MDQAAAGQRLEGQNEYLEQFKELTPRQIDNLIRQLEKSRESYLEGLTTPEDRENIKDLEEDLMKMKLAKEELVKGPLEAIVTDHGEQLKNTMDKELQGDQNGHSYLTKEDVEKMLDAHFKKMELLFEKYMQQPKPEPVALKEKLDGFRNGLKDQVREKIEQVKSVPGWAKQAATDKISDIKNHIKGSINKRIEAFNGHVRSMTQSLEKTLTIKPIELKPKASPQPTAEQKEIEALKAKIATLEQTNSDLTGKLEGVTKENKSLQKKVSVLGKFLKENPLIKKQWGLFLKAEKAMEKEKEMPKAPKRALNENKLVVGKAGQGMSR